MALGVRSDRPASTKPLAGMKAGKPSLRRSVTPYWNLPPDWIL